MAAPLPASDQRKVRSPFWAAGTVAVSGVELASAVSGEVIVPARAGESTVTCADVLWLAAPALITTTFSEIVPAASAVKRTVSRVGSVVMRPPLIVH